MSQIKVSYKRHLAKTISYRILSTTIGFLGMWWISGSIKVGAAFGVAELIYKPLQYYIHERVWYRYIRYGLIEEKKKKQSSPEPTEVKVKPQIKVQEDEPPLIQPPPPRPTVQTKKVLNYTSSR